MVEGAEFETLSLEPKVLLIKMAVKEEDAEDFIISGRVNLTASGVMSFRPNRGLMDSVGTADKEQPPPRRENINVSQTIINAKLRSSQTAFLTTPIATKLKERATRLARHIDIENHTLLVDH